jgi:hypothetical protein
VDYTREPIIETVITPKEGCKLVLRNTKGASQEEYFVDAVEVVTFGTTHFFRSLERPKPFLIPTTDFEVLEVREPRMILKAPGQDRSAKPVKESHQPPKQQQQQQKEHKEPKEQKEPKSLPPEKVQADADQGQGGDRRRNRRSSRRRGREREDGTPIPPGEEDANLLEGEIPPPPRLISPPPTLISETLTRYRESEEFKGAFYDKEAERESPSALEEPISPSRPFFSENGDFSEADDLLFRNRPQEASPNRVKPETEEDTSDPFDNPPLIDD